MKRFLLILMVCTLGFGTIQAESPGHAVRMLQSLRAGLEASKKNSEESLTHSLIALDNCKIAKVSEEASHIVELQAAYFAGAVRAFESSEDMLDYVVDILEGRKTLE